jgi:hypothetical protein
MDLFGKKISQVTVANNGSVGIALETGKKEKNQIVFGQMEGFANDK